MRWCLVAAVLATACYSPAVSPGAPCGPGGACPSGQECRGNTCFLIDTPYDAAIEPFDMLDAFQVTTDAPPDGPPYIAWGQPVEILSLELAENGETDPSISSDGRIVTITATSLAVTADLDLFIGTRSLVTDPFLTSALTALNSTSNEKSPELSSDGKKIYFCSNVSGAYEVYVSTETAGVWAAPTLEMQLSSTGSDSDLAVSPDGLTAVVVDDSGANRFLFHSRASTAVPFGTASQHAELHITADIAAPTITNDAATIYFHAGATRDLYVSHRKMDGTYEMPVPVAELNTAARDAAPFVAQGDNYMLFERTGDIFETKR